jgi:hypothetical protein
VIQSSIKYKPKTKNLNIFTPSDKIQFMNPEAPECIACEQQCTLLKLSDIIISRYKNGKIKGNQVNAEVSTMTLKGNAIGCPAGEQKKMRKRTFDETNPYFGRRETLSTLIVNDRFTRPK